MVKKTIPALDMHTTAALMQGIQAAAAFRLQDNEFWESVEQKLVDQNLVKYLSLEQMG